MLIIGDFNYWPHDAREIPCSVEFTDLLSGMNYTQHIKVATHIEGHILDQVWTSNLELTNLQILPLCTWSDHLLISFSITRSLPVKVSPPETIMARNWSRVDTTALCSLLATSMPDISMSLGHLTSPHTQVEHINTWLDSARDSLAPLKRIKNKRPHDTQRWFTNNLKEMKLALRQSERKWRQDYCPNKKTIFILALKEYKSTTLTTKTEYFSSKILELTNKSKDIFSIVDDLAKHDRVTVKPTPSQSLCDSLNTYFIDKIVIIQASIPKALSLPDPCCPHVNPHHFDQFPPITQEILFSLLKRVRSGSPTDSCPPHITRMSFSTFLNSLCRSSTTPSLKVLFPISLRVRKSYPF